jgi:hypothetical protein
MLNAALSLLKPRNGEAQTDLPGMLCMHCSVGLLVSPSAGC